MSSKLKYNFLGKSGLKVSNLCLGCMTFGAGNDGVVQCNEEESHKLLDRFVDLGGNFIDTANVYQHGESEEIVGSWLSKQQRENLILATKVRFGMSDHANGLGLSRVHIMTQIEQSLKRLKTHYIDLYQIHCWDPAVPLEETLSTMEDLVKSGKVRYVGASNVSGWQLQKIVDICRERGYNKWISLQQQYSLMSRQSEFEVIDVCKNEGIGLMPWSPLKGGWLTGKIKREGHLEEGSRIAWSSSKDGKPNQAAPTFQELNTEQTWNLLDLMEKIAKNHGKTVAQVALRWLLQKDVVSSVVIGAKTMKQLDDNLGASAGWTLSQQEMEQLDDASAYEVPYPYELLRRNNKTRLATS